MSREVAPDIAYTVSPDILHLRESNNTPSDVQIQKLRLFRAKCEEDVAILDTRIAELNAELAWLIDQRSLRNSQAVVCTSLLSPFRRLPPEIIGEIFLYCLPETSARIPSRRQAPLLLCQVCSKWREIALGMSKLWEVLTLSISYERPDGDGRTAYKYGNAVKQWISRVGETSQLDYCCEIELSTETCEEAPELISHILLPYTHRCRRLDLRSWDPIDFGEFLSLPSYRLPQLESLALRFNLGDMDVDPTVFETAPYLRRVSLMSLSLVVDPTTLFPWAQLTHLAIANLQPKKWATLFRQCHNLQHGIFILQETSHFDEDVTTVFEDATFLYLVDLRIVHCNNAKQLSPLPVHNPPHWLLNNLNFPALSNLDLSLEDGGVGFNIRSLRRPPALTSLHITNGAIAPSHLIDLLREIPSLTELELRDHDNLPSMFNHFTRYPTNPQSITYLPNLEKITIHVSATGILPHVTFSDMIKSRWWWWNDSPQRVAILQDVSLFAAKDWIDALVEVQIALQQCELEGMRLNLQVMPSSHWDIQSRESYMEYW